MARQRSNAIQKRLPLEAYESLFLYLAGETYEELIRHRDALGDEVDTDDIAKALERMESRGRFVRRRQRDGAGGGTQRPVGEVAGVPAPVAASPWLRENGTVPCGSWVVPERERTVVAMHRARWLARNLPEGQRILFVTFTRNLAADIENNLRSICSPQEMTRIEVTNLDRWVHGFLRRRNYDFQIVYNRGQSSWTEVWRQALELKDSGPQPARCVLLGRA